MSARANTGKDRRAGPTGRFKAGRSSRGAKGTEKQTLKSSAEKQLPLGALSKAVLFPEGPGSAKGGRWVGRSCPSPRSWVFGGTEESGDGGQGRE